MKEDSINISRDELYEKVWEKPISRLASDYGLSDVGLRKICKKLNIPTPSRGYWARRQNGYKVSRLPLPKRKEGETDTYTIDKKPTTNNPPTTAMNKEDFIPDNVDLSKPIIVNKILSDPHPLVKKIKFLTEKTKPDDYGMIQLRRKKFMNFRVAPGNLSRALRILDCIIKWFETNGYTFNINDHGSSEAHFLIHDEKIKFGIFEKTKRSDHIPTKKELEEQARYSWRSYPKWDYTPTGKLSVYIDTWGFDGVRKNWSDTGSRNIESVLNDFITNMFQIAYLEKQETIRREEERKRWRLEQERLAEEEKRRKDEEQKLRALENQAAKWITAKQLRNYIQEVKNKASKMELSPEVAEKVEQWISWANRHADDLDPLYGDALPI